jgi:hypothetical protein
MSDISREERWRADVLSSSLPLEYQVASIIVKAGFSVTADYSYSISNGKEYSVDISAFDLVFQSNVVYSDIAASLRILAECKYRRPNTVWLFVPDPNERSWKHHRPGATLRAIDQFSPIVMPTAPTGAFDEGLPVALKGIEIRLWSRDSNRVDDQEMRHGLDQLQFAVAPVLGEQIRENLESAASGSTMVTTFPICLLPVIVTTAEIRIAGTDFSGASIENTADMNQWSEAVPSVVLTQSVGPLATRHFRDIIDGLNLQSFALGIQILRDLRKPHVGNRTHGLPGEALDEIRTRASIGFLPLLRQCLICRLDALSSVLTSARETIQVALDASVDTQVQDDETAQ